ncbi:MAG TPA: ATP-binding cassette domain-containing protein [Verrucomicrobiales bacterium]|nr:ATP-binding cassette domain-containing protein [Verrucomicrobiales bacterium]
MPDSVSSPPYVEVRGLKKRFGRQEVLRGVDLDIAEGETLSVIGGSGAGKTVLLKHVLGLVQPDAGEICIGGTAISQLRERQLGPVRRSMGVLFQNGALFDSMSVAQNVAFPLRESGLRDPEEIERRVREALVVVKLEEHFRKMPGALSGGMRKRVALARAIVTRPRLILYDEPTAGLDPVVSDTIDRLIKRLQSHIGATSLVITHNMRSVATVSDRVAFMRDGKVYFYGSKDELMAHADPAIRDFIEGRSHELEDPDNSLSENPSP